MSSIMFMKTQIENEFKKVKGITVKHIHNITGLRFDYDCKLYREGTVRDILTVMKTLGNTNKRILDMGCGFGGLSAVISSFGYKIYGIDIRETADYYNHLRLSPKSFLEIWQDLEIFYPGVLFKFYEPYTIPFDTGFFDAVIYYAALEHIPKDSTVNSLKETHRVLKENGNLFIFRCPNEISVCENLTRFFHIPGHEILYGEGELKKLIKKSGFRIMEFRKTDLFPAFLPISIQWLLDMNGFWLTPLQEFLQNIGFEKWAHHFSVVAGKNQ